MSLDFDKLLKEYAGFDDKNGNKWTDFMTLQEDEHNWYLHPFRDMDIHVFKAIGMMVSELGGGYKPKDETHPRRFIIPKQAKEHGMDSESVNKEPQNEIQTPHAENEKQDGDYSLAKSMKKYGQLVPCLADAQGNVFDGFHRIKINSKAWVHKHDQIKTPVDKAFARLIVNFNRRQYTSEEMKNDIGLLSGSGYSAQDIQDITGIGLTTIYKYYPQERKQPDKVHAGEVSGETRKPISVPPAEQTVKTQDTFQPSPSFAKTQQEMAQQVIDCETCGNPMDRSRGTIIGGKIVCPKCSGKDKPLTVRRLEDEPAFKPKETPDFRVAQMHPKVSKMDTAMLVRLQNNEELRKLGWRIEFQKPRTKVICISDVTLVNSKLGQEIDVYFDFTETHKNSQVEDDFARQEAARIHKVEVLPLLYDAVTETEECRLEKGIIEQLKNRGSF